MVSTDCLGRPAAPAPARQREETINDQAIGKFMCLSSQQLQVIRMEVWYILQLQVIRMEVWYILQLQVI